MNAPELLTNTRRRTTDIQRLAKWGYDENAPDEIVEMAKLCQQLTSLRVGEIVVHMGFASADEVDHYISEKPSGILLLDYLAARIEGLRPEIQRILTLQDGMPYYRQLGALHPDLQDDDLMEACSKLEATLTSTPTGEPCLVFTEFDKVRQYSTMGRQEQFTDPIRKHFGRTPILAVGARPAVLARLDVGYSHSGELEQTCITPASAITDLQKRIIHIIEEALHRRAGDIAFQPEASGMTRVRMRIDGDMVPIRSIPPIPPDMAIEIANILHGWSNATYTSTKARVQGMLQGPADGKLSFRSSDRDTFIRAAFTLPDSLGGHQLENIALRLLDRNKLHVHLTDLHLTQDVIDVIGDAMHEPSGIVLLVGGTGSGKSTTLHGALDLYQSIHGDTKNCMSLEDPVERLAEGLVAHSINKEYGFDLMMAAILRQNPDLVYIGEMRDRSSASTGIRAANSGHNVLSSLHANDSFTAIGALRGYIANHMADNAAAVMVSDFDLVSSINLIVAQRLVPALCPSCRVPTSPEQQAEIGKRVVRYAEKHGTLPLLSSPRNKEAQTQIEQIRSQIMHEIVAALAASYQKNPTGCKACEGVGTIGKRPLNEYFVPDVRCKQLMIEMLSSNRMDYERLKPYRPRTLFQSALERVKAGETPPSSLFV